MTQEVTVCRTLIPLSELIVPYQFQDTRSCACTSRNGFHGSWPPSPGPQEPCGGTNGGRWRQAWRCSWRIGQTRPVKVVFMAYRGTLQADALKLVARKLQSSLAVEGELHEDGLAAYGDDGGAPRSA